MSNSNSRGQQRDKPFRDALRVEAKASEAGEECVAPKGSLRWIARQLLVRAGEETAAAAQVGDRLDGKPAQAVDMTHDVSDAFARLWAMVSDGAVAVQTVADEPKTLN